MLNLVAWKNVIVNRYAKMKHAMNGWMTEWDRDGTNRTSKSFEDGSVDKTRVLRKTLLRFACEIKTTVTINIEQILDKIK